MTTNLTNTIHLLDRLIALSKEAGERQGDSGAYTKELERQIAEIRSELVRFFLEGSDPR